MCGSSQGALRIGVGQPTGGAEGSWAESKSDLTHGPTGLPPTPCLCACMPVHKCRRHRPRPATAIFVGPANRVPRCHGLHVFGWGGPRRKPPTGGLSKHPSNQCATKLPGRPQRQPMSKLPPSLGCSTGWLPRQTPNTASWDAPTWSLVWCLACCHQQVRECQPMATHTPTHPQCQRQWAPPFGSGASTATQGGGWCMWLSCKTLLSLSLANGQQQPFGLNCQNNWLISQNQKCSQLGQLQPTGRWLP